MPPRFPVDQSAWLSEWSDPACPPPPSRVEGSTGPFPWRLDCGRAIVGSCTAQAQPINHDRFDGNAATGARDDVRLIRLLSGARPRGEEARSREQARHNLG